VIRVRVFRGEHVESEHEVLVGGPHVVYARSAAKPLQALPALRAGVLGHFGLDDRHLAIACASHGGSDAHVALVGEILAACGLSEQALGCGPDLPRDPRVHAAPARIRHNCSGKHALGLALCVLEGWPTDGYWEASHPLQRAMFHAIAEATGVEHPEGGVDGCGMTALRVPLDALGSAFASLDARAREAMLTHPELIAFDGAVDTELLRRGRLAKVGADGVLAVEGVALKVVDGGMRALDAAAALLFDLPPVELRNSRGEVVGRLEAAHA
jgi:L-asparaginase II